MKNNSPKGSLFGVPNKHLILVIDDTEAILDFVQQALEMNDYKILTAQDIVTGSKIYKNNLNEIDLVILDMQLGDIDHEITIPLLVKINPEIKIFGMSGLIRLTDIPLKYRPNIVCFLQKPFSIKILLTELNNILKKSNESIKTPINLTKKFR